MLKNRFGFPAECILVLTDDQPDPYRRPTRANMTNAMRWLLEGQKPGDSLFFSYSVGFFFFSPPNAHRLCARPLACAFPNLLEYRCSPPPPTAGPWDAVPGKVQ